MTLGFESAMTSFIEDAAHSVVESIASDGLIALKSVLDSSGFADSKHLKDYEVFANVTTTSVEYEIVIKLESISESAKESLRTGEHSPKTRETPRAAYMARISAVSSAGEAKKLVKTYALTADGRPYRLEGVHDARKSAKDARKPTRDARTGSDRRARTDAKRGSGRRLVEHTMTAYSPRGLDVDSSGLLHVAFQREVRTTGKTFVMPKGSYQGIVKKFVDKIRDLVENDFSTKFEEIVKGYGS